MSSTVFFTGFPGFLGRELLPRVLARNPELRAICLVQDKFMAEAQSVLRALVQRGLAEGRVELVRGDIVRAGLGLPDGHTLARDVREIYHLAAIYDLSVPRAFAMQVNVEGTRNVLDFAARCPNLDRFQYVSTCYVSGRYTGIFDEQDLEKGQTFNNFYEETKYLAEVLVRERMEKGLRATIYRPSIVVGDSKTGATLKLDGPYYLLRWLLRQPKVALLPVIGDPSRFRFNVVPCDFVLAGIDYLSSIPGSLGKTYQLSDHAAPTCEESLELMARAADRRVLRVRLNPDLAKAAIERLPGVYRAMQIPASLIDYMRHPTHYHNRATLADLAPIGLSTPHFADYVVPLANFVRQNLAMSSAAMA